MLAAAATDLGGIRSGISAAYARLCGDLAGSLGTSLSTPGAARELETRHRSAP
nr:hypothetical protein [Mycobacterium tuberculosis]